MDPVTGVGLAASVIQLLKFSIDVAKTCRTIYDQGSTDENVQADLTAGHLLGLTTLVQQRLHQTGAQSTTMSSEEKEIIDLVQACEDCAKRLHQELEKAQMPPRASIIKVARKTARSVWSRSTIVKIQDELESYRRVLDIALLNRLR